MAGSVEPLTVELLRNHWTSRGHGAHPVKLRLGINPVIAEGNFTAGHTIQSPLFARHPELNLEPVERCRRMGWLYQVRPHFINYQPVNSL